LSGQQLSGSTISGQVSRNANTPGSRGAATLALIIMFVGAGLASVGWMLVIQQQYRLATYIPVRARVGFSRVVVHRGKHTTYLPDIGYIYSVDHRIYQSHRVFPTGNSLDMGESAYAIVRYYHHGLITTAWRSPIDPGSAFLIRKAHNFPYILCLFPAVFFFIGLNQLMISLPARRNFKSPEPDGTGWCRLSQEGTLAGRFRIAASMSFFWVIYCAGTIGDYFWVRGKQPDAFLELACAAVVLIELMWLVPACRYWMLSHDFLDADVRISPFQLRAGQAMQISYRQEVLRPVEIERLSLGLVCMCVEKVRRGTKTSISSTEDWAHRSELAVGGAYGAGGHLEGQDRVEIPASAKASTPRGQKLYPQYCWHVALEINSRKRPKLRLKYPVMVESGGT
jgi:hypothetical protein